MSLASQVALGFQRVAQEFKTVRGRQGLPSYVPATVLGPYDPMFCAYNALPSLLRKTEAGLARAAAGGGRMHVLVLGDSMGLGYNGTAVVDANSFPKQISTALAATLGIPPGGSGMTPVVSASGVLNDRWTTTGTVNTSLYPAMLTMSSGSTATFAPPESGTLVAFTYSDLSAAFSYAIDGAAGGTVTPGGTSATKRVVVDTRVSGPHTVRITQTAASGNVFLYTGEVYATTGVSVHNLSYGGSRAGAGGPSASWTDTSSASGTSIYGARKQSFDATGYTPDVVIVCLGPNDVLAGDSNATALGGLLTMKGWYPTADFVVVNTWEQPSSPAGAWDSYRAAKYSWCDSNGAVYIDLSARFGPVATAQANGLVNTTDNVHPTNGANREIGRLVASALVPTSEILVTTPSIAGPADAGFQSWSVNPAECVNGQGLTSGRANVVWMPIRASTTLTSITVNVVTAGASLTVSGMALYDQAGNLLSNAPLSASAYQTAAVVTGTLTTPVTLPAGSGVYVALWSVGTTLPLLARSGSLSLACNLRGPSMSRIRFGITATSTFTSSTPPAALGTITENAAFLAAVA